MRTALLACWMASQALMGCGTMIVEDTSTLIDPKLRPAVEEWVADCKRHLDESRCNTHGIDSITLVDALDENTIGRCVIRTEWFKETRKIEILRGIRPSGYYMRALMLHEMMHCRLGFERHEDVGVMGEQMMMGEKLLEDNWPELLEETYSLVK